MKHTVSLRRAVAVGAMAAATCSLVTGMAVYGVAHPSGELAEIYDALEEVQAIVDSRFVGDYDMDEVRDYDGGMQARLEKARNSIKDPVLHEEFMQAYMNYFNMNDQLYDSLALVLPEY